jgi:transposase
MQESELAKKRATLILQVRSGKLTAQEAANQLGVSRKTYYEWEARALEGMMEALSNGQTGRPAETADTEKEALKQKVASLEKDLMVAKQTLEVRDVLQLYKEKQEHDAQRIAKKKDHTEKRGS